MQAIVPLIVVVVVVAVMVFMRSRQGATLTAMDQQYAHARAGALAQRMGLALTAGEPEFNFYMNPRRREGGQALYGNAISNVGKTLQPEYTVRIEGAPNGRRVELLYHDKMNLESGVLEKTLHTWLDARLTVAVGAPFPAFEVHTRNAKPNVELTPETTLAPQSFGDPAVDGLLVLKSGDARMGPALAPALKQLYQTDYVHILGRDGVLTFRYSNATTMSMGDADKLLPTLDAAARAIEDAARSHMAGAAG